MKRWTDPLYWIAVGTLVLILAIVVARAALALPLPAEDLAHLHAYHHQLELDALADLNGPYRQEVMPNALLAPQHTHRGEPTVVVAPPLAPAELRVLVEAHFRLEWVDEALAVAWCESRYVPTAYNQSSGASGIFQHLARYWPDRAAKAGWTGADIFDPEANVAVAAWLSNGGSDWSHWVCAP